MNTWSIRIFDGDGAPSRGDAELDAVGTRTIPSAAARADLDVANREMVDRLEQQTRAGGVRLQT